MKLKSDVLPVFIDFHLRVERQFNQKIISLQSDWGGEFQALNKHLTQQGISHRVSCPHTPAQNGIAKRKHHHVIEIALSLLRHSSVPHQFWDEAVCTMVYLINRLPVSIPQIRSPYHLVYNQEPASSLLKSFGCTCYPCLKTYATSKMDSRSERCVFLGYSALYIGYRCLSLTSGKIYISRDIIFKEHDYPYKKPSLISNSDNLSTLELLGSSQAPILFAQTSQSVSPSTESTSILSTPLFSLVSTTSIHEWSHSPKFHDSSNQDFLLSPNDSIDNANQSKTPVTSHIPSTNPLSPSNLDSHTSSSLVKIRRLSDILRTVDSVKATQSTKYPLPMCLHTSASFSPEPATFISASKHPEWIAAMQDEFNALIQNQTWKLVPRPSNRPVIGCK